MAKTLNLRAPKTMKLNRMSSKDVEAFVAKESDRMLSAMPKDVRISGINAVAIESIARDAVLDADVWVQWTRACCDSRPRIDDFIEPVVKDFDPTALTTRPDVAEQHIESLMRTETLTNPRMHGKDGKAKTPKR
jgi:hypothetical protein